MNKLNEIVDCVFVLNLDKRNDRMATVTKELERNGIEYARYPAVNGDFFSMDYPGISKYELACSLSHFKMINHAAQCEYSTLCVFEDDVIFAPTFEQQLELAMEHLPSDWCMLYLGANNLKPPVHVSGNVYRVVESLTTHAYILNNRGFELAKNLIDSKKHTKPIDNIFTELQKTGNVYIIRPNVVYQREGYSDIRRGFRNYDIVLKK